MSEVRIEVLGPVRARVDGVEQRVGGRRERVVLGLLAASAGRPVPVERLVDTLWGEEAPASAQGSLQVAVSRLRTMLAPERRPGEAPVISRSAAGYALVEAEVDAAELSAAASAVVGRGPAEVAELTEAALALWQGEPYADLRDVAVLDAEVTRLHEDRLRLYEARTAALLDLGRHDEAQAVLATLVEENPFRERLWSLLAVALYRCDRQAEALETLRRLRTTLADELGVDPSPSVRTLEEDLLAQAPHLAAPAGPGQGTPVAAAADDATRSLGSGVVGRSRVLAALDDALDRLVTSGRGGVTVLTGEAGIGKSMLSAEVGRRARRRGVRVAVGRCHEADLSPAYWPWLPVLRAVAGPDPEPEVALLVGDRGADAPEAVSGGAAALRTYDAVTRLLAATPEPLLVVLEDLHWADTSSLRLLAYAAEALRDAPVLLLVTARESERGSGPGLTQALAALARLGAVRLRVPHLGVEAVAELLLDEVADPDEELAEVLWRRTDGNPFFVLEMARLLTATGEVTAARAADLDVPDGIADVLRLRLLQLGGVRPGDARRGVRRRPGVRRRRGRGGPRPCGARRPRRGVGRRPRHDRGGAGHLPLRARADPGDGVRRPPARSAGDLARPGGGRAAEPPRARPGPGHRGRLPLLPGRRPCSRTWSSGPWSTAGRRRRSPSAGAPSRRRRACGPARSTWSAGPPRRTPDVATRCSWARRRPGSGSATSAARRRPSTRRWRWPARSATTA